MLDLQEGPQLPFCFDCLEPKPLVSVLHLLPYHYRILSFLEPVPAPDYRDQMEDYGWCKRGTVQTSLTLTWFSYLTPDP